MPIGNVCQIFSSLWHFGRWRRRKSKKVTESSFWGKTVPDFPVCGKCAVCHCSMAWHHAPAERRKAKHTVLFISVDPYLWLWWRNVVLDIRRNGSPSWFINYFVLLPFRAQSRHLLKVAVHISRTRRSAAASVIFWNFLLNLSVID